MLLPDGPAQSFLSKEAKVAIVQGPLVSFIITLIAPVGHRTVTLYQDGLTNYSFCLFC